MLSCSRPVCLLVLLVAAGGSISLAQSPSPPETSAFFRSGTDLVSLDVSVEHDPSHFVPPLTADEFLVLEDNIPQKLTLFSAEGGPPLEIALLIDHSQSMAGEPLDRAKTAAAAFLHTLEPDDRVEILAFNDATTRLYPLGGDRAAAERATADRAARGATGLYDAVLVGLRDLERARRDQTKYQAAIVILSDGADTVSRERFEDVLEDARRSVRTRAGDYAPYSGPK